MKKLRIYGGLTGAVQLARLMNWEKGVPQGSSDLPQRCGDDNNGGCGSSSDKPCRERKQ
ncbi:hypothetical protein GURASL_37510 [Geotalea uraniireducens]|uniref:Uncharacterized protein n=1 Tax=Geotalea uraniireducens TaxID=351604 RepID=A0ABM8ERG3_9BACT|nr:hypothetical protein GURASL_37510 [Geotalea uraniireducens]